MKKFWYSFLLKLYWRIDPKRIKTNLGLRLHTIVFRKVEDAFDAEFDSWYVKRDSSITISDADIIERLI